MGHLFLVVTISSRLFMTSSISFKHFVSNSNAFNVVLTHLVFSAKSNPLSVQDYHSKAESLR